MSRSRRRTPLVLPESSTGPSWGFLLNGHPVPRLEIGTKCGLDGAQVLTTLWMLDLVEIGEFEPTGYQLPEAHCGRACGRIDENRPKQSMGVVEDQRGHTPDPPSHDPGMLCF